MTNDQVEKTDVEKGQPATEAQRMANTGVPIFHKKTGQDMVVKELTMESIIRCASELATLLTAIDWTTEMNPGLVMTVVLQDDATANAFRRFAAESTKSSVDDWTEAGVGDWLRFIRAARKVNDWSELKELFTEAGLAAIFQRQKETSQADSPTPTPSEEQKNELPTPLPVS